MNSKGQSPTKTGTKNGPEMAQTMAQTLAATGSRRAKNHQDFWRGRLVLRSYRDREGKRVTMPEWHVRIADAGRREWFNLGTANQTAAAIKARDIYLTLISSGWAETVTKYKPDPILKEAVSTVGNFLTDVRTRSHLKPMTMRRYAVKLRKMIADLAKLNAGVKGKALTAKFDYVTGGRADWLAKIDSQSLGLLTPKAITGWRNSYVVRAGSDPIARKSAERSAASYLRCVRALFTPDITGALRVNLPPHPFEGVKLKDPGAQRYHSEIDPMWLLGCAERELRVERPQEYLALSLCLWAGLRRREADLLTWSQIDFESGQIHVRRTVHFEPKTEESQRDIDLGPEALDAFRSFKAGSQSEFVLDGSDARPSATYDYYRADRTWRGLNDWLRLKGVRDRKAIHALRKESGSLMASRFGIEAARQHLGHRDIRTTSAHYVGKKGRREVNLSSVEIKALEG